MDALKLFESFTGMFLEVRVGTDQTDEFLKKYASQTGENVSRDNAFMVRTKNGWPGALDTRVYFNAPEWVLKSLAKLGYRVVKRQIDMEKYDGGLREYPWKISSNELFWAVVSYGYRVGQNDPIPHDLYLLRQLLKIMDTRKPEIVPGMEIRQIESENFTIEAMLFADMKKPMAA